ncbi:MAG: YkgJ family cysteine cluster protein [Spirochaetaceae bacterium]|nr:YkgJ family cysteine cluster protein [Spirochaetaceae bacterium]
MFQCSQCGICCRRLPDLAPFDKLHDGDGVCRFLDGSLCSIYDERPLLCRVDESYHLFEHLMSYEEYLEINYTSCVILQGKK